MKASTPSSGIPSRNPRHFHKASALLIAMLICMGCAPHSHEIRSKDVPLSRYEALSCLQINAEMSHRLAKLQELAGVINDEADDDEAQTAVGFILFWPAFFFLEGSDTPEAQEYAQLRGELLSLEHNAIMKECEDAKALAAKWHEDERKMRAALEVKNKEEQSDHSFVFE